MASGASTPRAWTCRHSGSCRSAGRATSSQTRTATGSPTWGLLKGLCWGRLGRGGRRCWRRGGGYLVRLTTHGSILSPMKDMRSFTVPGSIPCDTISTATGAIFPLMASAILQARCRTKGKLMPAS